MRAFSAWILLCGAACSEAAPAPDATEQNRDAGPTDADAEAQADAEADAAIEDARPPPNTVLPLGPADVIAISEPGAIDLYGVVFETDRGQHVYYERFDEAFTRGRISVSTSTGGPFSTPEELELGTRALRGSLSAVGDRLYFAEAEAISAAVQISHHIFDDGAFTQSTTIAAISGVTSILSWPRFIALTDGRTAVAFRDRNGRGRVALSEDGEVFSAPAIAGTGSLAQPELAELANGGLSFAFQTPVGNEPMVSFFQLSPDGIDWSEPVRLSTSSANVHDTRFLRREDGELDAYYIFPVGPPGFSIFRRKISLDGALGPEQQVTTSALGDATKPAPHRLRDGSILLLFAEITRRAPQGYPSEQILRALRLRGDAPP